MRRVRAAARAAALAGAAALALVVAPASAATAQPGGHLAVAVIVLDVSSSPWKAQLADERQAATAYAGALPAGVETGLITFSTGWRTVLAPTASRASLAAALAAVRPAGLTSSGIGAALSGAAAVIGRLGASADSRILVLSDGERLTAAVPASSIPVDVITWSFDSDDAVHLVRQLAARSGGKVGAPSDAAALAGSFVVRPASSPSRPASPAAVAPAPPAAGSLPAVLGVVFVVLLCLALLGLGSLRRGARGPTITDRIERYGPRAVIPAASAAVPQQSLGKAARAAVSLMGRLLSSRDAEPRLARRLDRAGIGRAPAEWALLGVCACIGLAGVLTVILGSALAGVPIGVGAGWLGMRLLLSVKIDRRRAAFDDQLPNVLQLVAGSIQTGLSLNQALDAVVREDAQPASGEFARALAETRLGVDVDIALSGVADRLESADLRWVAMAIRVQRDTGGNLAEVLRNTVATMRERAYLRRQVRSLSAEGRLSAYILILLPIVVGAWLFYSDPVYMKPLHTTVIGIAMLVIAAALVVIGGIWMRNLIKIKV